MAQYSYSDTAGLTLGRGAPSFSGSLVGGRVGRAASIGERLGRGPNERFSGAELRQAMTSMSGDDIAKTFDAIWSELAEVRDFVAQVASSTGITDPRLKGPPLFSVQWTQTANTVAIAITGWIPAGSLLIARMTGAGDADGRWDGLSAITVGGVVQANNALIEPGILDVSRFPDGGGLELPDAGQNLAANAIGITAAVNDPGGVISVYGPLARADLAAARPVR